MDWKSKRVRAIVDAALLEDKAACDISTALTIDSTVRGTGTIFANEICVVSPAFLLVIPAGNPRFHPPHQPITPHNPTCRY